MALPEIRLLQAAIALAEELNYSRAAARLRIEQSTLSKRIVELESQIDLRLFVRNHQTVELTEAGRHFVEEARNAILHAERAVADAKAAMQGADQVLHIGRSVYADLYLVTAIQSIRLPLFPCMKVKLWSNFSHELARMVATGNLDLALVVAIPDTSSLSFLSVAELPVRTAGKGQCGARPYRALSRPPELAEVGPDRAQRILALFAFRSFLLGKSLGNIFRGWGSVPRLRFKSGHFHFSMACKG